MMNKINLIKSVNISRFLDILNVILRLILIYQGFWGSNQRRLRQPDADEQQAAEENEQCSSRAVGQHFDFGVAFCTG